MKSFEVLAKITTPVDNYTSDNYNSQIRFDLEETIEGLPVWAKIEPPLTSSTHSDDVMKCEVIKEKKNIYYALDIMDASKKKLVSRDREVFGVLVHIYSRHHRLLTDLGRVIKIMCKLQPALFILD